MANSTEYKVLERRFAYLASAIDVIADHPDLHPIPLGDGCEIPGSFKHALGHFSIKFYPQPAGATIVAFWKHEQFAQHRAGDSFYLLEAEVEIGALVYLLKETARIMNLVLKKEDC